MGLFLLNGVSPSLRVEYKMQPQSKDPVNGNNMAAKALGLLQVFLLLSIFIHEPNSYFFIILN